MPLFTFLKRLVLFPLDLVLFSFDFLRLLIHLVVKRFNPSRGCAFCFDSSDTRSFPRPCRSASRYSNLWLFKLICPSVRRAAEVKEGECPVNCFYKASRLKPYWVRYGFSGLFLTLLWCGILWLGLVKTNVMTLLRHVPDPTSLALNDRGIINPSLFKRALFSRKNPERAKDFLLRARAAFTKGDFEAAKLAYLSAKKYDPDNAEIRLGLGNCYYRLNKKNAALMEFENAARMNPESEEVHEKLVELHAVSGNFKKAIKHGEKAILLKPQNVEVRLLLARSYVVQEKPEESRKQLEAALVGAEEDADAITAVARIFLQLEDYERAEALYRQALEVDPKHLDSLIGLAGLLKGFNQQEEAARLLEQSKELAPGDVRVAVHYAEQAYSDGQALDAIQMYRQIVDRYPEYVEPKARLAEILLRTGEADEGLQLADGLVAMSNPTAQATGYYILANYYFDARLHSRAISNARKVIEYSPRHVGARMLLVKALLMKKEYDRCAVALKKLLQIDPENIQAHTALARILIVLDNKEEGLKTLTEAVDRWPESAIPCVMLGNYYYSIEDYVRAQQYFETALEREPDRPEALNSLAMCLLNRKMDIDKAFELSEKLINRFPGHPIYADTYGWSLYHKGQFDEALRLLTFAQNMLPRNPEIRYHIGMIHFRQNSLERARIYLELALKLSPDFAGVDDARKTLESLSESGTATL